MNFPNVQVLNASSRSEFFGDNVRWKTVYELNIEGSFLALSSTDNTAIHSALNSQERAFFQKVFFEGPITINGTNFGDGYVSNFSSQAEGTDVQSKRYTATVVIRLEGNLKTIVTEGLGQVDTKEFQYIESFSESSTFNSGEGVKDSYSQNIDLNFVSKTPGSQKSIAEKIIKSFINNNLLTTLIAAQYQKTGIKKYYTQSYDEINNSYSTNVNFELAPRSESLGNSDTLIVTSNVKKDYLTGGIINISEDIECIGNSDLSPEGNYNLASAQVKALIESAFSRLSAYIVGGEDNPLIDQPLSKSFVSSQFEGRATGSIAFSNSKEVIAEEGYWEFTINIQKPPGGNYVVNENGSIIGGGVLELNNTQKYDNAKTLWDGKKGGIQSRIEDLLNDGGTLNPTSTEETHSEIDGSISYNYNYSDNTSLFTTDTPFLKKTISITTDKNRNIFSTFNIIAKNEIAQRQRNLLPNNTTINIILNGIYGTTLTQYEGEAKSLVSDNLPVGQYVKLSNLNYDFSPNSREFKCSATYFKMEGVS
jgi:hypothetical protein